MIRSQRTQVELNCERCAGCCIDWRPLQPPDVDQSLDHERGGRFDPLDDVYNLAPLTSDEVRAFIDADLGAALMPRVFEATERDAAIQIDGYTLAAVNGRPTFLVGLRKPPKPVAPFGVDPTWLPTCVFLDPTTLQCRIHDESLYPETCDTYPADNLTLGAETECERVEASFGSDRLTTEPGDTTGAPRMGRESIGSTVFAHPEPARLSGVIERLAAGAPTLEDRAEFVSVAAASRPGSFVVDTDRMIDATDQLLTETSWVADAIRDWEDRRGAHRPPDPSLANQIETKRGAPPTPGWSENTDTNL